MNLNAEIGMHTRKLAGMKPEEKQFYLQDLIGPPSQDKQELHMRALLMSKLNECGIGRTERGRQSDHSGPR